MEKHLYVAQRLTAIVLAPLVLIHLVLILYAIDGGLSAGEILGRTRGHLGWAAFYSLLWWPLPFMHRSAYATSSSNGLAFPGDGLMH